MAETIDWQSGTKAERGAWVLSQVSALGLTPKPNSRLLEMKRVMDRGKLEFDDPEFWIALEVERDMAHLAFVFEQLLRHPNQREFNRHVKHLLNDSALPQQNLANSPGRDKQFELYLAATCQNADLLPIGFGEPDVTCEVDGRPFGIAAKRLKNIERVDERIWEAVKQFERARIPGVVALDLSFAWNRANRPMISQVQSQMCLMILHQRARQFFDERRSELTRILATTQVRAFVVFDFTLRLRPNQRWGLDGLTTWFDPEVRDPQFRAFYGKFVPAILGMQATWGTTNEEFAAGHDRCVPSPPARATSRRLA